MTEAQESRSRPIAGKPGDFALVTHLRVQGSQKQIGTQLAETARRAFGAGPKPIDPLLGQARRRWFEEHWPAYAQQREGMAVAFGVPGNDDSRYCEDLNGAPLVGGCSAVWSATACGGAPGIVRNFDIHSSVIQTNSPGEAKDRLPFLARPYLLESHPTDGALASLVLTGNNLAGALEGINEAGLAVVELADNESRIRAVGDIAVGLHEGQIPRFVLDTCRTAAEAREALRSAPQYDRFNRCQFLIADAAGDAFVWAQADDDPPAVFDADADHLVMTNYLLSRHPNPRRLPDSDAGQNMFGRARTLSTTIGVGRPRVAEMHAALDLVRAEDPAAWTPQTGGVTFWRTEYDCAGVSMRARFLLGVSSGQRRYSPEVVVVLNGAA